MSLRQSDFTSRREALRTVGATAAGIVMFSAAPTSHAAGIADQYDRLRSADYIGGMQVLATVTDDKIFTEGPAADAHGNLFFTNTDGEKIYRWDGTRLHLFRDHSNAANGLYIEPDGSLLACEGGAGRVTRTNMKTGAITVVADKYNGFLFAAPNDVCVDVQGRIYFTSRPGTNDPAKGNPNAVYRIGTDGSVTQILAKPEVHMPNGIVISPDHKTLYVIEAHPGAEHNRSILACELSDDGNVGNPRVLINFYPGRSGDGMCIDAAGNLYVAAGLHALRNTSETLDTRPGIHVISPEGRLLAFAQTPKDTVTNCTFGGADLKTLYVTCGDQLVSYRTTIAGKDSYRPNG